MSAGAQTPKIIVSYRRTDAAMAGRIFDRLVQRFGKKSLFIDIDNIPFGGDFRRHIDDALKSSDLLIALVGPRWAGGEGKDAKITREADPVRGGDRDRPQAEHHGSFPCCSTRRGCPSRRSFPKASASSLIAMRPRSKSGRDFDIHVDRLIKAVEQILGSKAAPEVQAATTHSAATLISPAPVARRAPRRFPMPLVLGGAFLALAGAASCLGRDRSTSCAPSAMGSLPYLQSCSAAWARNRRTFRTGPPIRSSHWARMNLCRTSGRAFTGGLPGRPRKHPSDRGRRAFVADKAGASGSGFRAAGPRTVAVPAATVRPGRSPTAKT